MGVIVLRCRCPEGIDVFGGICPMGSCPQGSCPMGSRTTTPGIVVLEPKDPI